MTVLYVKSMVRSFWEKLNCNLRDFEYNTNIHSIAKEEIFL